MTVRLHSVHHFPLHDALGDVVFLHGLMGHHDSTWRSSATMHWPLSLANQHRLNVYSLEYPAPMRGTFSRGSYDFLDLRNQVLQELESRGIGRRPFVFVCHSLGGILVKSILRRIFDRGQHGGVRLLRNCAGIAFIAVPHRGSYVASLLGYLQAIYRTSPLIDLLQKDCAALEDVNHWFVSRFAELGIRTITFVETKGVGNLAPVVTKDSATLDLPGSDVIEIRDDHIGICKPENEDDLVYRRVELFCEELLGLDKEEIRIIAHFLDHHFLAARNVRNGAINQTRLAELRQAMKVAWLCADQVILAASSLFESDVAKAVLSTYPPQALTKMRIAGRGINAENYARSAQPMYIPNSDHHKRYIVDEIIDRVPFLPRARSATAEMQREWASSDPEACVRSYQSSLPAYALRDIAEKWRQVPDMLAGAALIPEYILPLLVRPGERVHPAIEAAVNEHTNRWYFESLCSEFTGVILEGIPYLDTGPDIFSKQSIDYRALCRWLQGNRVLQKVLEADENKIEDLARQDWVERFRYYARVRLKGSKLRRSA
jgi:pimeloyl-ACP methyl ester carboxylesterase